MRVEVEVPAPGAVLRGWLFRPPGDGAAPGVVMFHGLSAVKEMHLDDWAEELSGAGLAVLLLDNRNFGASDGEPRQELDPWVQIADYRHAITWLATSEGVDATRIGVFGISVSGGHALVVAATDPRVRCVVSVVPMISGPAMLPRLLPADLQPDVWARLHRDRVARMRGEPPEMIAVVTPDRMLPAVSPQADAWEWFTTTGRQRAPAWRNELTLRSLDHLAGFLPGAWVPHISPTPLLMVVADGDHVLPADLALDAFAAAREPKRLIVLPGGHFEAYTTHFAAVADACRWWYRQHLLSR